MTTDRITPTFAQMLADVLAKPGIISAAYCPLDIHTIHAHRICALTM